MKINPDFPKLQPLKSGGKHSLQMTLKRWLSQLVEKIIKKKKIKNINIVLLFIIFKRFLLHHLKPFPCTGLFL